MEKICVAVRLRPTLIHEASSGAHWQVEDNRISLHRSLGSPVSGVSYAFDHVFDQGCTNSKVYDFLTRDIIDAAVEGFNGTVFAYGQTSSGKTFTMNGSDNDSGIVQRAVKDIFKKIQMTIDREFLIRVSYMEIYNEEINDLFAVENQRLRIHESLERGIFVAGLREEIVNSSEQVLQLLQSGEVNRHFGETNMNIRSSRSHTIFRMVIESKGKVRSFSNYSSSDDAVRVSVLNLVDLAGSERIAKTGADGVRLKEGKHINKSLMVLGNVINKLSDGAKHRGHIPYRDSKLTRILQPALGGNAKTSIICTLAPEEVHIEETRGTLQFASRAKCITNCVQVNEILTDAALLKRQKLEIEDLRSKLQGSHAEVLEQEILKLRNDMLKSELEREKLALELEEERKLHRKRDQCIREQQLKIDNLSNLVTLSDTDRNSSQGMELGIQSLKNESNESFSMSQEDAFETPSFKAAPKAFVVKRSQYNPEYSPIPDTFSNVADEDTWMKLNKGFITDLDSLQTPARKVQSFPWGDTTPAQSFDHYGQEVQNLQRQLQFAIEEKEQLKRNHAEQMLLNDRLMGEIFELQQEATQIQELPRRLKESVANCRDIYADVWSNLQSFIADENSTTAKLLSSAHEIGTCLFSTLENHFLMAMDDHNMSNEDKSSIEQHKKLSERLTSAIASLVLSDTLIAKEKHSENQLYSHNYKGCNLREVVASWKDALDNEVNSIKERYLTLEKDLTANNQLLEVSRERYHSLQKEFLLLKEDRDALLQSESALSERIAFMNEQKDNVLQELDTEILRRKDLENKIKQFSNGFACRHKSFVFFQSELKSKIENLKSQNPMSITKPLSVEH